MDAVSAARRPARWAWAGVAAFLAGWVLLGCVVVYKAAALERPQGDLSCYLTAAWAVQTDPDHVYDYTDQNGWHYNYPPLLAIMMAPLAQPPLAPGADHTFYVVAVAVVYVVSVLCLFLAVHVLASALEKTPAVAGRWWTLRLAPILACLPPIGHTLVRGQMNLLVLALLCGAMALLIRRRAATAGGCLAGAACIKIFPAFLFLYPLWRRDWRCLAGGAAGLAVGLAVVPAAVLGPARTVALYGRLAEVLVGPALHLGPDESRATELIRTEATDSQSFLAVIHNTLHLDRPRWARPQDAAPAVRWAHLGLGALMTGLTLLAAWRRRPEGAAVPLFLGALTLCMVLLCPVCHTHYFALSLPLVMGLLAREWEVAGRIRLGVWALLAVNVVGNILPLFPALEVLKDAGLATYTALALWAAACLALRKAPAAAAGGPASSRRAAA
jgi:hypothetical protein